MTKRFRKAVKLKKDKEKLYRKKLSNSYDPLREKIEDVIDSTIGAKHGLFPDDIDDCWGENEDDY